MRTRSFLLTVVLFGIVLAACSVQSTPTAVPAVTVVVQPTGTPIKATSTQSAAQSTALVTVNVSGVAQDVSLQVVAPVPSTADAPWWMAMPEHTRLSLQGYSISDHLVEPQILVYPVRDLGINQAAETVADDLQTLLRNHHVDERMPFLPLYNAAQMMHTRAKYLDFANGQGVRFLTWYSQGIVPVNNHELLYTYQGLTSDGEYYVAAVLPINLPELPADGQDTGNLAGDFSNDYLAYLADMVTNLEQRADDAYTPDLGKLDAMMQSIEIVVRP